MVVGLISPAYDAELNRWPRP
ncbi:MAG: hypothetical protein MOP51_1760, partial [Citricoccus sp.]|nr:hypothetical protein [Citricoccus sp. WCRC_4]